MNISATRFLKIVNHSVTVSQQGGKSAIGKPLKDDARISDLIETAKEEVRRDTRVPAVTLTPYFTFYSHGQITVDWSDVISSIAVRVGDDTTWDHPTYFEKSHPGAEIIEEEVEKKCEWLDSVFVPALNKWIAERGWEK